MALLSAYVLNSALYTGENALAKAGHRARQKEILCWMEDNLKKTPKLLVDDWRWKGLLLLARSGFGYGYEGLHFGINPKKVINIPCYKDGKKLDSDKVLSMLQKERPRYMLYTYK